LATRAWCRPALAAGARVDGCDGRWVRVAGAWASQPTRWENVTIRLPAEVVKGRVIDLEGRPIAGVRVGLSLRGVPADRDWNPIPYDPKDESDRYVTAAAAPSDQDRKPAVTDADGRVTVRGLGQGWLYDLYISGPTVVNTRARLVARPRKPGQAEASGLWMPDRGPPRVPEFGSEFTFVATPSKPIRGAVREKGTGQPLTGCHVHIPFTRDDDPRAWADTDAAGRYTLTGLPRGGTRSWCGRPRARRTWRPTSPWTPATPAPRR
jgi:hypothetical protein